MRKKTHFVKIFTKYFITIVVSIIYSLSMKSSWHKNMQSLEYSTEAFSFVLFSGKAQNHLGHQIPVYPPEG